MAVKNNLRQIRKSRNLTQANVADAVGISRQAYVNIELGKSSLYMDSSKDSHSLLQTTVRHYFGWMINKHSIKVVPKNKQP